MDRSWDKSRPPQGPFALNRDCPQAQGLVGWWPVGPHGGGKVLPDLANTYTLTTGAAGTPTLLGTGAPAVALAAASNQYLLNNATPVTGLPLSIAAWGQTDGSTQTVFQILAGTGNHNDFCRIVLVSNKVRVNVGTVTGGAQSNAITTASYTNGRQHLFSASCASSTSRTVYLDGTNAVTDTTSIAPVNAFTRLRWGIALTTADALLQPFNGSLGETGLWNRALSADEHMRLWSPATRYELWYPLRSRKWFTQGGVSAGPVGLGSEIDTSFSPGGLASGNPGRASETNASLSPGGAASGAVALSSEVDTALVLTGIMRGPVGAAVEVDTALGLGSGGQDIGTGVEADAAFGLSGIMFGPIGLAQESDAAISPGGDAQPSTAAGGGDDDPLPRRKRRYVVNDGDRLLVFDSQRDALAAQARIDAARTAARSAIDHAKKPAAKARIDRRATDAALGAFPAIVPLETVGPVELAAAMDFDASGALRALVHQQAEAAAVYEALEQARDEDDIAALLEYA